MSKASTQATAQASGHNTVITRNGKTEIRSGGTLAWRNNNPGNIRAGKFATSHGAIGTGPGGFAVFPDEETGKKAIKKLLNNSTYKNLSVEGAISRYAPPVENDTIAYQNAIKKTTGLDINRKINELQDNELDNVVSAIRQHEGWNPGSVNFEK